MIRQNERKNWRFTQLALMALFLLSIFALALHSLKHSDLTEAASCDLCSTSSLTTTSAALPTIKLPRPCFNEVILILAFACQSISLSQLSIYRPLSASPPTIAA